MITEDYVSFEVAKLLKEKGFDWEWSPFYSEQDKDEWAQNNNYNISNPNYDPDIPFDSEMLNVIAPHVSLQIAMKWLREVHNLHIAILWDCGAYTGKNSFCYHIDKMDDYKNKGYNKIGFDSYEQACEAAIGYCLTNLI